jgi:DNA-binding LacI/PurR family transcriptional regulator
MATAEVMSKGRATRAIGSRSTRAFSDNGPRARAIRHLQEWIANGALPHGQPLPAERELAARLRVNRGTLRSALEHLSEEGFLRSNGGRIRIVTLPRPGSSSLLQDVVAVFSDDEGKVSSMHQASGWMDYVAQGSLDAIRKAHLHALVVHPSRFLNQPANLFMDGRPRGAVLMCSSGRPEYSVRIADRLQSAGVRVVLHGDDSVYRSYDRVTTDHEAGSYLLTQYFIRQGRKRILNFWPEPATDYWFLARRAGYERAMAEAGLAPLPTAVVPHPDFDVDNADDFAKAARLLAGYLAEHLSSDEPVDTLLLASDGFVPTTTAACRLFGKEPNRDIWIGGYDNYWADLPQRKFEPAPPAVTVDKNNRRLGEEMVNLLLGRPEASSADEPERRAIAPELVFSGRDAAS